MANRVELSDEEMEKINGGYMDFNAKTQIMTFLHADGSVTTHQILDYDNAWYWCNYYHGINVPEENILNWLVQQGYVQR